MRRLIAFDCAGETLHATLDDAGGTTGVLIVSGGNEIRIGAHRGMAALAGRLADAGIPSLRYDRRGIGDSSGTNGGFESGGPDLAAAAAAFRSARPGLQRIVGFGNCDAASALALFHADAGLDALLLSNPWIGAAADADADADAMPAAAAIRARYAERVRDPRQWLRLLQGGVDLRKLFNGLLKMARKQPQPAGLLDRMADSLAASGVPLEILLARRDNTAIVFADAWAGRPLAARVPVHRRDSASHSYAAAGDAEWLAERLIVAAR